jgi:hypothetical protein
MEVVGQLLMALLRVMLVPVVGYGVVRCGRRWPRATLAVLLTLIVVAVGCMRYAAEDGFRVDPVSRLMTFGSEAGEWCFAGGWVLMVLGIPALPLVAFARAPNGEQTGPVGAQWAAVLFGYFMACLVFSSALYSWLTGIVK